MDGSRLDRLAAALARPSRRVLAGKLVAFAALLAGTDARWAEAADDGRCVGRRARSNRRCGGAACFPGCVCTRTAAGELDCLDDFARTSCPATDECDDDGGCPPGSACAQVGGCCPDHPRFNACLERCPRCLSGGQPCPQPTCQPGAPCRDCCSGTCNSRAQCAR